LVWHRWASAFAGDQMRQPAGDGACNAGGALIGEFCNMEKGINTRSVSTKAVSPRRKPAHESFIQSYVAIIVLFCASGTGIFGAMREGMTGDPAF
jgi:uncharacterized membrane protein YqgA involved in biofilm formation